MAPARRNRCDLAVLNAQHLLRKPVCAMKAPLGLSCLAGTAALFFSFGVKREHPSTNKSFPVKPQSSRSRQRLPPRGSWQNRQVLTEGVKFPLPCNDSPCSTVCSMGKSVEILSGGRGEDGRQNAGFGTEKLYVLQILTKLSQKIRRPAIESTRLACIIGMLGTHCPQRGRNCCAGRCGRETVG